MQKENIGQSESINRKYKVLRKGYHNDRDFIIQDILTKEDFTVDFYTDGGLEYNGTEGDFGNWLDSFIGKVISIPEIYPRAYFTRGEIKIVEDTNEEDYCEICGKETRFASFCGECGI